MYTNTIKLLDILKSTLKGSFQKCLLHMKGKRLKMPWKTAKKICIISCLEGRECQKFGTKVEGIGTFYKYSEKRD